MFKTHHSHPFLFCLFSVSVLFLSACASVQKPLADKQTPSTLAATDFVANIEAMLNPRQSLRTLHMPSNSTDFGHALRIKLREAGYHLVAAETADSLGVSYEVSSLQSEQGASSDYRVAVGPMKLQRTYVQDATGIYPATAMSTEIVQTTTDSIANDPFAQLLDAQQGSVTAVATQSTNDNIAEQTQVAAVALADRANITPDLPASLDGIERLNMYKTRESSFAKFTLGYKGVSKQILDFPNDSLTMSSDVENELYALSQLFRADTDVFSVIGCSHGKTKLENGNALLAVGRSKRVAQYLVEQGIPVNRILDEGCWAPVHFDGAMPRRGVVVELKRKAA